MIKLQKEVIVEPQATIFDLDGTLFKSEEITTSALQAAADQHGITLESETINSAIGRTWQEIQEIVQQACGTDASAAEIMALCDQILEKRICENGVEPKEGLGQLLDFLEGIDLPRAIATAGDSKWATMILGQYEQRFSLIVTSDHVKNPKPDPEQLLLVAEKLKKPPANCVFVGDCSTDIEAAKSSGMISILIPGISACADTIRKQAHLIADSLRDVQGWISSCLSH